MSYSRRVKHKRATPTAVAEINNIYIDLQSRNALAHSTKLKLIEMTWNDLKWLEMTWNDLPSAPPVRRRPSLMWSSSPSYLRGIVLNCVCKGVGFVRVLSIYTVNVLKVLGVAPLGCDRGGVHGGRNIRYRIVWTVRLRIFRYIFWFSGTTKKKK